VEYSTEEPLFQVSTKNGISSQELKWKPKYAKLEEIVSSAWEWHRKHPNGYK
jgi:UDP-glucose 4-epimerase